MKLLLCVGVIALHLGAVGCRSSDHEEDSQVKSISGSTYKVGPNQAYSALQDVADKLKPGDVVEVYGGHTYPGNIRLTRAGTAEAKITIRGISVRGGKPIIAGGTNTIEFNGNHYVFENFEVKEASFRCIFHHAHDITIRDTVVHDCKKHGILGADTDSGSLTLDRVEVYGSGQGTQNHQIYMATDESAYPGSVFRMQNSYVHDARGGNSVKTRAERNEIYYNWIEGSYYHDLELIGPDPESADYGEKKAREDSDVVGNVIVRNGKNAGFRSIRIGGDGTGQTWGRYRFVNNTMVMDSASAPVFFHHFGVESVEMHNNLFLSRTGGGVNVWTSEGEWATGRAIISGSNNFLGTGSKNVPSTWTGTQSGDAGIANLANLDFKPLAGSLLVNAGNPSPKGSEGYELSSALHLPAFHPPHRAAVSGDARPAVGAPDIGAYEYGLAAPVPPTDGASKCVSASQASEQGWLHGEFSSRAGILTAQWDVTPSAAGIDAAVALSQGAASSWTGLGAIVRFNPANMIDVRNGTDYQALTAFAYKPNTRYRVRAVVDVKEHRYDVFVAPAGGSEVQLAKDYAFRSEQSSVTALDHWVVSSVGTGSLQACDFAARSH
ncbi:MAG TPA: hypothetical protein VE954_35115 [Oligoflexus sp.]|uniref:hypothetical protein n=1 Tax=Oligoflexus sp. TaxID=1971216 RepID=UPI002D369DBB|nr:hypothetical protein [Oligoflexus sp.]HYX38363.1 hypothetical protein [Oligoflexus sp.]